jgi:hypothetical protein
MNAQMNGVDALSVDGRHADPALVLVLYAKVKEKKSEPSGPPFAGMPGHCRQAIPHAADPPYKVIERQLSQHLQVAMHHC